jgi:hypothetical protein
MYAKFYVPQAKTILKEVEELVQVTSEARVETDHTLAGASN